MKPKKPKLKIADAIVGGLRHLGYDRDDLPMFHTVAAAPGGGAFSVHEHFAQCTICRAHGVTAADVHEFMVGGD